MNRLHERGHASVVADGIRELLEHEFRLDPAAVAVHPGRLRVDDARKLTNGFVVPALVDKQLPLRGGTGGRRSVRASGI
jgi:hypothetical protein